jgi:DNA-directed RNA polymerase alpha subunit
MSFQKQKKRRKMGGSWYKTQWRMPSVRRGLEPAAQLKDEIRVAELQIPTRIMNSLTRAGLETVGEVRRIADIDLGCIRGIGPHALHYLRDTLGRDRKLD